MQATKKQPIKLQAFAYTLQGTRKENQDSSMVLNEIGVYAVADGVGGGVKGDVASQLAVTAIKEICTTDPATMKDAFKVAQKNILDEAFSTVGEATMGTTLTAAMIKGDRLFVCHVGDTRCYLYADNVLKQLTDDQEHWEDSIKGPVLASYLGIPEDYYPLNIVENSFPIEPGNRVLICSDGLYRQIEESRMSEIIQGFDHDPQRLLEVACEEAAKHPHSDNVTAVLVQYGI